MRPAFARRRSSSGCMRRKAAASARASVFTATHAGVGKGRGWPRRLLSVGPRTRGAAGAGSAQGAEPTRIPGTSVWRVCGGRASAAGEARRAGDALRTTCGSAASVRDQTCASEPPRASSAARVSGDGGRRHAARFAIGKRAVIGARAACARRGRIDGGAGNDCDARDVPGTRLARTCRTRASEVLQRLLD
jgi:hypothetical protein